MYAQAAADRYPQYSPNYDAPQGFLLNPPKQRVMAPAGQFFELSNSSDVMVSEGVGGDLRDAVKDYIGLEGNRSYTIVDGRKKDLIYVTEETANFCQRNCVPARCRPESTAIYLFDTHQESKDKIAELVGGCCRPVQVKYEGRTVGTLKPGPWNFSHMGVSLSDTTNGKQYEIRGDRFSMTRWIGKLPCILDTISFRVYQCGRPVADIRSEWAGFIRECIFSADDYHVVFEEQLEPRERFLLMCAALYIDSLYFSRMCSSCTLRTLALSCFTPAAKATKLGKYVKYVPVLQAVTKEVAGRC